MFFLRGRGCGHCGAAADGIAPVVAQVASIRTLYLIGFEMKHALDMEATFCTCYRSYLRVSFYVVNQRDGFGCKAHIVDIFQRRRKQKTS